MEEAKLHVVDTDTLNLRPQCQQIGNLNFVDGRIRFDLFSIPFRISGGVNQEYAFYLIFNLFADEQTDPTYRIKLKFTREGFQWNSYSATTGTDRFGDPLSDVSDSFFLTG